MSPKRRQKALPRPQSAAEALEAFDGLYAEGDLEAALAVAADGVRRFGDSVELVHAHGLALWGLGKFQKAAEAMQEATRRDPALPEPHLDLAALLVDPLGAPEDALRVLRAPRRQFGEPAYRAAAHALRAQARLLLEDPRTAVKELRKARRYQPEDAELAVELASALLEALDPPAARAQLDEALALDPESARAHWMRAVLLDREGSAGDADAEFGQAARLAPDDYFVPERLSEEEFDAQVEKAIREIPLRFRRHLDNVELAVEPYPSEALMRAESVSPFLLGLFLGTPMTERSYDMSDLPPRILIFQRNLENTCRGRRELVREIGVTVRHEIGHLLGMDEDAIDDAGHG